MDGARQTRMRSAASPRFGVALAAALLVVSLGLPWGSFLTWRSVYHPGYFVPGLCRTVQTWDGWYESVCEQSVLNTGTYSQAADLNTTYGAQHGGRFGVAAGLALIAFARRPQRRRTCLLLAAGTVAVITVLTSGLGFGSAGSSAAWLSVVLLVIAGLQQPRPLPP